MNINGSVNGININSQ